MENKLMKQSIRRLDVEDSILDILEDNDINTLGELCGYSKSDLKKYNLSPNQIDELDGEVKLAGLYLRNSI